MGYIKDFIYVHKTALINFSKVMKNLPIVIISLIAYSLLTTAIWIPLRSIGGIAAGLLMSLLEALMLSHLMLILDHIINGKRIKLKDTIKDAAVYFGPAITIRFVLYIIELLISRIVIQNYQVTFAIDLLILIIFSPAIESVYIGGNYGYDFFSESIKFISENIINWVLPIMVVSILAQIALNLNLDIVKFNPIGKLQSDIALIIVKYIIMGVFIIYKGSLYKILNGSTRRKREYMRKF